MVAPGKTHFPIIWMFASTQAFEKNTCIWKYILVLKYSKYLFFFLCIIFGYLHRKYFKYMRVEHSSAPHTLHAHPDQHNWPPALLLAFRYKF